MGSTELGITGATRRGARSVPLPAHCPRGSQTHTHDHPAGPGSAEPEGYIYSNSRGYSVILVSLCTPQGIRTPGTSKTHNGFRGLSPRSGAGYRVCIDTVLSFGNTASVMGSDRESGKVWEVCHQNATKLFSGAVRHHEVRSR